MVFINMQFIHCLQHIETFLNLTKYGVTCIQRLQIGARQRDIELRVILIRSWIGCCHYPDLVVLW